ncbi:ATP-binding protein [Streptomyces sp. NPDC007369]|uniref:ATP-binding protein n=1 Tax=Streptomyces sp. NPDC007369 TaxID=3154589 RepID=UPI00340518A1
MALQLEQRVHLNADTEAAATARSATLHFFANAARAGRPVARTTADIALLVVSELVTNAVRHTAGPCSLHLARSEGGVDIDVADTSPDPPVQRPPHVEGVGGWGWILVNHLTQDLAVQPTPDGGKTIHARVTDPE